LPVESKGFHYRLPKDTWARARTGRSVASGVPEPGQPRPQVPGDGQEAADSLTGMHHHQPRTRLPLRNGRWTAAAPQLLGWKRSQL